MISTNPPTERADNLITKPFYVFVDENELATQGSSYKVWSL